MVCGHSWLVQLYPGFRLVVVVNFLDHGGFRVIVATTQHHPVTVVSSAVPRSEPSHVVTVKKVTGNPVVNGLLDRRWSREFAMAV